MRILSEKLGELGYQSKSASPSFQQTGFWIFLEFLCWLHDDLPVIDQKDRALITRIGSFADDVKYIYDMEAKGGEADIGKYSNQVYVSDGGFQASLCKVISHKGAKLIGRTPEGMTVHSMVPAMWVPRQTEWETPDENLRVFSFYEMKKKSKEGLQFIPLATFNAQQFQWKLRTNFGKRLIGNRL